MSRGRTGRRGRRPAPGSRCRQRQRHQPGPASLPAPRRRETATVKRMMSGDQSPQNGTEGLRAWRPVIPRTLPGDDLPGPRDVVGDRGHQLLHRVVPHLVAKAFPELDGERLSSQVVALVVEQERLGVQRLGPERGVRPDVDRRQVPLPPMLGHARVDPLPGEQQARPRPEVGGGEPETGPAAVSRTRPRRQARTDALGR